MGGLRPATVEELAAQERAAKRRSVGFSKRPLVVGVATFSLLIAGAGAFALARTAPTATMVQPSGSDAPFGVGYVDGFGEHTPKPSRRPPGTSRSKRPRASVVPSESVTILMPSQEPEASAESVSQSLSAVYWTAYGSSSYDTYVWVSNEGEEPVDWQVRVKLPDGATISDSMAVSRSYVDGVWTFKSGSGRLLPGGRVYLFAFSGSKKSGSFALRSCMVNASACVKFF